VSKGAYRHQKDLESGAFRKVGVNCYEVDEEDQAVEMHPYKVEDAEKQEVRLQAVKADRDHAAVDAALATLKTAAAGTENMMPALVAAVKVYASVGEMNDVLMSVFGRYQEPEIF